MFKRALEGKEKAWGREHTSTLNTVNNLGTLFRNQGRLQEAEAMYKRALDGYEAAFGATFTFTNIPALQTLRNFGLLCERNGQFDTARLYYQRALVGTEAVWGQYDERYSWLFKKISILESDT
ncbi:hypothetical protein N7490_010045 [Penicillium lividum]|nr:hypothetical protein N7490_010045 [Penicillium lividum]